MATADVALWIQRVRRQAGFASQDAFARELGIGRTSVTNWETGRGVPSMAHAERFAVVTGRDRSEVLAKFGYPIGGGEPIQKAPAALPEEWSAAIQKAVSAGIADGVAEVLDRLRAEGLLPAVDTARRRSPQRRSA